MQETKVCTNCKVDKPRALFYINDRKKGWITGRCKECINILKRKTPEPNIQDLPGEIWKDIPEYEGYYQASNLGRIKSISKMIHNSHGTMSLRKTIILKPRLDNMGYEYFRICRDMYHRTLKGHRLVAQTFIPNPENKKCVNHIDFVKTNNRIENLEWVTYSENTRHSFKHGVMKATKGFDSTSCKLNREQVAEIRELKGTMFQTEIAKRYNVVASTISKILNNKRFTE